MFLCWYAFIGHILFPSSKIRLGDTIDAQSFWLLNQPPKEVDEITIVAIDEASRKHLDMKWPWKRSVTAKLIENIAALSPQVIGLDIVFSGTSEKEQDDVLISALKAHPNTILGYTRMSGSQGRPNEQFTTTPTAVGFVDKPVDAGLIRNIITHDRDKAGELHLSLDIQLVKSYFGLGDEDIDVKKTGVSLGDELFIPAREKRTPLNYLTYPTDFRTVSASRVINNRVDPSDFENKIVLVGATDPLIHDEHPTILGTLPGVTILGNAVLMLVSERFLLPAPMGTGLILALVLGCTILIINKTFSILRATFLTVGLLVLAYLSFVLLRGVDIRLPYFLILLSGGTGFLAYNGHKYISLLFVTNKIKRQAILDPLTGMYTPRYFRLQLHERLKERQPLSLVAIRINNYQRLSVDLDFTEFKHLLKDIATLVLDGVNLHFSRASVSRLYPDTFGIESDEIVSNKFDLFWQDLLRRLRDVGVQMENEKASVIIKGAMIRKPKGRLDTEADPLSRMECLLKEAGKNSYVAENFSQVATEKTLATSRMDMLDFLSFDWDERNKELENYLKELIETNRQLNNLNWGALSALARTIDAKSTWTAGHSERVTHLAMIIGEAYGLDDYETERLHRGALLHDIGKIAIPASILDKPGKLTDQEYRTICEHPARGARILEPIEAYSDIIPLVRQHHERFDGKGYPDKVAGEDITKGARILAVADVYDALTSDRPYRQGMSHDRAITILREGRGTQFDPEVVDTFLSIAAASKIGTVSCSQQAGERVCYPKTPRAPREVSPQLSATTRVAHYY